MPAAPFQPFTPAETTAIALSLKERRSRSIGVIVAEIANSFFSQAINGIESIANINGYNVIISQSRESFERELSNLQYLTSRSIDLTERPA